jgi:hypothetical protein
VITQRHKDTKEWKAGRADFLVFLTATPEKVMKAGEL